MGFKVGAVSTLGSGAPTLGSGVCVCMITLGAAAGVVNGSDVAHGGTFGGVGVLKMALRLSTARSWAWQLSGVRSAWIATVSAQRQ